MRVTPKRVVRAVRRRLRPAPEKVASAPEVVRERVVVRQLVLPEEECEGPEPISELDRTSLLGRHALPPLERMAPEERAGLVDSMLSVERMRRLGIRPEDLEFPEASWKRIYNEVWRETRGVGAGPEVAFSGATASELNALLRRSGGASVDVESPLIVLDETVVVPGGVALRGRGARVVAGAAPVAKAFVLDGARDVLLDGFELDGCCDYPVYVKNSERFVISGMRVTRCAHKAVCVMGACRHFAVRNNRISDSGNGAIFLNGDVELGVIERNVVERAGGTGNLSGGIVLCSSDLDDIDTPYNPLKRWCLAERLESPHDLVIVGNRIGAGESNGIYSHASYRNYIIENTLKQNNKEGMCLDFGTVGCFVARNVVLRNGGRFDMDEEKLVEDFIQDFGVLSDGSSPAKVPGISMDNAAYNILYQNVVAGNYGSGIKMVRSGARNTILSNVVTDNNAGESEGFHFFGIELASDLREDYALEDIRELDFTPCYENTVARNIVSGPHYAGVFLGRDAYVNDCFDNVVMDAPRPFEVVSGRLNARVNNLCQ